MVGEFKNASFFINRVDEFVKTLCIDGYENEINLWLDKINDYKKNITIVLKYYFCTKNNISIYFYI